MVYAVWAKNWSTLGRWVVAGFSSGLEGAEKIAQRWEDNGWTIKVRVPKNTNATTFRKASERFRLERM